MLYLDNCNACHRSDGSGAMKAFPALAGNAVVSSDAPSSVMPAAPAPIAAGLGFRVRMGLSRPLTRNRCVVPTSPQGEVKRPRLRSPLLREREGPGRRPGG
ncbi:c-type cytochrome [Inquilinus sp.]|uniref:c-type cytochrome n=1 Tax=Inquilinus sp. TaxID=1932117 RepID=UPI0031DC9947